MRLTLFLGVIRLLGYMQRTVSKRVTVSREQTNAGFLVFFEKKKLKKVLELLKERGVFKALKYIVRVCCNSDYPIVKATRPVPRLVFSSEFS